MGERYMAPIFIRQTFASVVDVCVWAMRNTQAAGGKKCRIKDLNLQTGFDGTVAASMGLYKLQRFSAATPTGGAALGVMKKSSAAPATVVTDVRQLDTGLTVAGVTFEPEYLVVAVNRQRGLNYLDLERDESPGAENTEILLQPGEGLCLRLGAAAVIGDQLAGFVEWEETDR